MKTLLAVVFCSLLAAPAFAVDGVVLINQSIALAGGVTPGDTPGFPVTISVAGSYRLSSNLVVSDPSIDAIEITADNVTIDLNGFSIIGPVVCTNGTCSPSGIASGISSPNNGITILNGGIHGMGSFEIFLSGSDAHVTGVNASRNANGITSALGGVFTFNVANSNGAVGFAINGPAVISENMANFNNTIGFLVAGGSIANNEASGNGQVGIQSQFTSAALSGNHAAQNGAQNIFITCPASATGNAGGVTVNGSSTGCVLANNSN